MKFTLVYDGEKKFSKICKVVWEAFCMSYWSRNQCNKKISRKKNCLFELTSMAKQYSCSLPLLYLTHHKFKFVDFFHIFSSYLEWTDHILVMLHMLIWITQFIFSVFTLSDIHSHSQIHSTKICRNKMRNVSLMTSGC